ncbi:TonB-dependent receptor [Thalassotalea sp. PP2-459]|uniref:TonB-dependent receptor n=1 Tax=Thalassotalea sp. PP2-459 TaxID=1742724 RepID=UPI0009459BD2|nr:TonB-dependent receptor [Thalassotalea sp. PP2-459]OKY26904.1 ligand-gated channel protein [Thalassotalea sp. PP2-459]
MLFSQLTTREKKRVYWAKFFSFKLLIFCTIILVTVASRANTNDLYLFEIHAQSVDKALSLFGQQTQQTLIYSYELTHPFTSNAVHGYYTQQQALRILLRNTSLHAKISKTGEIKIVKQHENSNNAIAKTNDKIVENTDNNTKGLIEKIAIIGNRGFSRSITELTIPVDILTNKALLATGETELGRMIQKLAPSFNFSSSSISDGTDVLKPATLRGLGPDQTLILINGKRRHHASLIHINTSVGRGTAGADINAIPANAIDRVEILRDGAAAQYGSDAIAGVINIVLKSGRQKNNISTSIGQYHKGDGETVNTSINYHHAIGTKGFINTTLSLIHHNSTDRSSLHGTCQYTNCKELEEGKYLSDDPREAAANRKTFRIGDPHSKQFNLAYHSEFTLAQGKLYSFAVYSERHNNTAAFFRHANSQEANPVLADGLATVKDGYLPFIDSDITDKSFTLGYKGTMAKDLFYDLSYSYGKNSIDYETQNAINASYANSLQTQFSPEDIRNKTPTNASAYGLSLSLQTVNLDLKRQFSEFDLAFGLEVRKDHYQVIAGEQYSYFDYDQHLQLPVNALPGIQGFPGISPDEAVDEQRDVLSFYLELNTSITPNIDFTGALRFDDYDGVNDISNFKLAANWQVNKALALRSSVSTGFRAPSMQQLYFNNTSTQFVVEDSQHLVAEQIGTFRNDSQLAKSIGIPTLKEEKSTNFSLGGVLDFDDLKMTLDYYAINIKDRIVISNQLCADYSTVLTEALAQEHVDKAQVFLNAADTKTRGLDFIATIDRQLPYGELAFTLAANITKTEVTQLYSPKNSELHVLNVDDVFSSQDISIIETWQPQDRVSFIADFQRHTWRVNFALNRYGAYTIQDGGKQRFEAEWLTDISIEQKLTPALSLYAGINNLFDIMPDKNNIGNAHSGTIINSNNEVIVESDGVFKYSRRSAPFGFNGQYYYVGLRYHF